MRWPDSVCVPRILKDRVNKWMAELNKKYDFNPANDLEETADGVSSLSIEVRGSGLGDYYRFNYKTFSARGGIDDDGELIFSEE